MPDRIKITPAELVEWTEVVPLKRLSPHPKNANIGDVEKIGGSLEAHGQFRAIIVSSDYFILAGNHTYMAAMEDDENGTFAVHHLPISHDHPQALEILAAENAARDGAEYDKGLLAALLSEVREEQGELTGTLYSDSFLEKLIRQQEKEGLAEQMAGEKDDVPPTPKDPICKPGDVWLLGRHILICGDATTPEPYDELLGDDPVDLVFTDPPYNVDYLHNPDFMEYRRGKREGDEIENDKMDEEDFLAFLRSSFALIRGHTRAAAPWYVCSPGGPLSCVFAQALGELEVARQQLVWVKDTHVLGRYDYHYQHEVIWYGWTPGVAHQELEDRTQSTTWFIDRPRKNDLHPTQKPVELVERALRNSGRRNAIVLDPFAGSGTTMIAAQMMNMRARMIEKDPANADVICTRWQEVMGEKPILRSSNEAVDFLPEEAA